MGIILSPLPASPGAVATVDAAVDAIQADIGNPSARTNLQTLEALLGNPDTPNSTLWAAIAALQADLGDPSARANLQTIEALLGNPDTAGKSVWSAIQYIVDVASGGLADTADSLSYRVGEIERHLHHYERWVEKATTPSGETHVADAISSGAGAFRIDAGNDTWGAWVQILGSSDTPIIAQSVEFDPHRLLVEATEVDATYFLQIAFGETAAGALTAGTYTEAVFHASTNQIDAGPVEVQTRRQMTGTKAWARCMAPGENTAWLDFYVGIHEYEG